ncbi:MAG: sensor histidine kinase, partial [Alphaproteobacteria bacterium]
KEKEYNEQQSQFMYMASHEFRTPLAIIDSSIQRLLRSKDSISADELQARCAKIQRAIGRMSALMESALAAARVDARADSMDFGDCDLNALVEEICERQQEISPSHVISFTPGELPSAICANASALDQVFTNLLSNAVKYSPDSPNIEVWSCVEGGEAVVRVRDYGRGIDAEDLPKMFRRYFRAKTAQGIAGTGIGLDIARVAVERHGGSISVESEPGRGSVFTVRLPVCGPAAVSESNAA